MKIKIIYEKPYGEGELSAGLGIDTFITKNYPNVKVEVVQAK
jgi:hypothetical protein